MSLFKYYGQSQDSDGAPLWWPGGPEGYPVLGPKEPFTKQAEYENLHLCGKARCKTFYLAKPDDLREYLEVRDRIVNGWFVQVDRERLWDTETQGYKVFLEWVEVAYIQSPTKDGVKDEIQRNPDAIVMPLGKLAGVQRPISETGF